MSRRVERIQVWFSDNSNLVIERYELERIEQLTEAINLLNRAKETYNELKLVFEATGAKK